jgi:hypothetical protein
MFLLTVSTRVNGFVIHFDARREAGGLIFAINGEIVKALGTRNFHVSAALGAMLASFQFSPVPKVAVVQ